MFIFTSAIVIALVSTPFMQLVSSTDPCHCFKKMKRTDDEQFRQSVLQLFQACAEFELNPVVKGVPTTRWHSGMCEGAPYGMGHTDGYSGTPADCFSETGVWSDITSQLYTEDCAHANCVSNHTHDTPYCWMYYDLTKRSDDDF